MRDEANKGRIHAGDVLVAVDGTEEGYAAVRYAAAEARDLGVGLDVVHVTPAYLPSGPMAYIPDGAFRTYGTEVLQYAQAVALETVPELKVMTELRIGGRVQQLVECAREARLVVLGSRPPSAIDHVWTGGTVTGVSSRADCPVLVVPAEWEPGTRHGRIVVGFKSPTHAAELLDTAFALADKLGDELVVLHAWRFQGAYDDIIANRVGEERWDHEERELIEKELATYRGAHPNVRVRVHVRHEAPARALVHASGTADRLVIVRPSHGAVFHHLGRTARVVLREAHCPVQVLAPKRRGEQPDAPLVVERAGDVVG